MPKPSGRQLTFDFLADREAARREVLGTVTRVIYANPDTGWKVVEVAEADPRDPAGAGTPAKLAGFLPGVEAGDAVRAHGHASDHPRFGGCLEVDDFEKVLPFAREAVARYLVAAIDGIGETLAGRIVERFGDRTLEVIESEPEKLLEVEGVTAARIEAVRASAAGVDSAVKELILEGFSPRLAGRVYLRWGKDAAATVRKRPYRLIRDFKGIGFVKADAIARRLGIEAADEERVAAGVLFTVETAVRKTGHAYLPLDEAVRAAARLMGLPRTFVLGALLAHPGLVVEERRVYLPVYLEAERTIAARIAERLALPPREVPDLDARLAAVEARIGLAFSAEQREAIRGAVVNPVAVVTGAAGTGKSTLCRGLLELLRDLGVSFEVCTPTGKAANRLFEISGIKASTIHRLLKAVPHRGFRVDHAHPLGVDQVVVDEASMVDLLLLRALLDALSPRTRIVFIGDPHQLPPVESGDALRGLVASYAVNQSVLPTVFRQKSGSTILENANLVNLERPFPLDATEDFAFVDVEDPVQMTWELYHALDALAADGFDPIRDVQVLTPLHKGGGEISVGSLNRRLRDRLNPDGARIDVFGREFRLGDKVMQRVNDYELDLFNGDVGVVAGHDPAAGTVDVDVHGGAKTLTYLQMERIVLNYACTVHKAQGSESRAVIFLATRAGAYFLLNKNLLYTAMTRAKERLVMIMPRAVVAQALRFSILRRSHLPERIQRLVIGREG